MELPDQVESREQEDTQELLGDRKLKHTAVQAGLDSRRSSRCVRDKLPYLIAFLFHKISHPANETHFSRLYLGLFGHYPKLG